MFRPSPVDNNDQNDIKKLIAIFTCFYTALIVPAAIVAIFIIFTIIVIALLLFTLAFLLTQEHIYMFGIIVTLPMFLVPIVWFWSYKDTHFKLKFK